MIGVKLSRIEAEQAFHMVLGVQLLDSHTAAASNGDRSRNGESTPRRRLDQAVRNLPRVSDQRITREDV